MKHRSVARYAGDAAAAATLVQAVSSFGLSQVLGVAAQRAITEMRMSVQDM